MIDADRLAITRKRRQQGRCVACGERCGCQVLCNACKGGLMYCPDCESTYPRRTEQRTSRRCPACRRTADRSVRARYLAGERARRHRSLTTIIQFYRDGLSYRQIGDALLVPLGTVASAVRQAKRKGQWPKTLKRRPGQRTDLRQQKANQL